MLSDEDLAAIQALEKKYDIQLSLTGDNQLFRAVYLMEVKGEFPSPIRTDLMLDRGGVESEGSPVHLDLAPLRPLAFQRIDRIIFQDIHTDVPNGLRITGSEIDILIGPP